MYFVTCSGGNDSIALIQFMLEQGEPFHAVYNNTGWAVDWWAGRMLKVKEWVESNGHVFHETESEGMKAMVRRKQGWPMPASKMQFCTGELKEKPSTELYQRIDPNADMIVVTGRRREESRNRADLPQWAYGSEKHGWRDVWNPLYMHTEAMRDELLARSPFDKLPHQSLECYPCVCANKSSKVLRELPEARVAEIEDFELSLGRNSKGNPRTMFRPYRAGGGVGIRQVVDWANGPRGWKAPNYPQAYAELPVIMGGEEIEEAESSCNQCTGGFCGD